MQLHFKVHRLEICSCIDEYMKFTFWTCFDMMVFLSFVYQINTKYIKLKAETKYFNSMLEIKRKEEKIYSWKILSYSCETIILLLLFMLSLYQIKCLYWSLPYCSQIFISNSLKRQRHRRATKKMIIIIFCVFSDQ